MNETKPLVNDCLPVTCQNDSFLNLTLNIKVSKAKQVVYLSTTIASIINKM